MYLWKLTRRRTEKNEKKTQERFCGEEPTESKKFPRVTKEIINQKIEKTKPTKIKEEKKEEREKFEINLQIQPFDFEISCSKYQNSATVKSRS